MTASLSDIAGPPRSRGTIATDAFDKIEVTTVDQLDAWLEVNHDSDASFWLVTYKKCAPAGYIAMPQVLDALIRHGWIDGIRRKLDEKRTMQLISKRRQQIWAKTYKDRAARLTADGSMRPWGLAAFQSAKRQGTWNAMADVDALIIPDDLNAQLITTAKTAAVFEDYPPSYRRNVLRWLASARTAETRAKRITAIAAACEEGSRIPQM